MDANVREQIRQAAMEDELQKIASSVEGIEDTFGTVFTPEQINLTKKLIKDKKAKSFILKHPWLTGIPTLGIAPLISNAIANQGIEKTLAKNDVHLKDLYERMRVAKASVPEND